MKNRAYLVFLALVLFMSCSLDDSSNPEFSFEIMPIEDVIMPDEFVHGETYAIGVSYTKPNSCYHFSDFAYEIDGNERIIAVVNTVHHGDDVICTDNPVQNTVSFDFTVTGTDTYVFKFFQGEDESGSDEYHIIEVPVLNSREVATGTNN